MLQAAAAVTALSLCHTNVVVVLCYLGEVLVLVMPASHPSSHQPSAISQIASVWQYLWQAS